MRVTQSEISRNFLFNLESLNSSFNKFSQQISSGKKLTQLKDSPVGSAEMVSLKELAAEIDQYRSNVDTGSYFLKVSDSVLGEVNNLATSIYARGSMAATETISAEGRAAIAIEIRTLRDQIFSLSNTQARGRYIFGGSEVTSAPFILNGDTVSYQGDGDTNRIVVDDGMEAPMNVSGSAAFNSIFTTINTLLTAIDSNNVSNIQTSLAPFSSALLALGQTRGQIGSGLSLLDNVTAVLNSKETNLIERQSAIEDADMAKAAVQLNQIKTAQNAAMTAGGSILKQSNLFDIIG
jgi:flagellar hook-associated protein 3 FlgL